jgi:hypothetical protein
VQTTTKNPVPQAKWTRKHKLQSVLTGSNSDGMRGTHI